MSPLFQTHMLNEAGKARARAIGASFNELLSSLQNLCPEQTREFSLVKTHLEQACFYAKKSIANQPENQETP